MPSAVSKVNCALLRLAMRMLTCMSFLQACHPHRSLPAQLLITSCCALEAQH